MTSDPEHIAKVGFIKDLGDKYDNSLDARGRTSSIDPRRCLIRDTLVGPAPFSNCNSFFFLFLTQLIFSDKHVATTHVKR